MSSAVRTRSAIVGSRGGGAGCSAAAARLLRGRTRKPGPSSVRECGRTAGRRVGELGDRAAPLLRAIHGSVRGCHDVFGGPVVVVPERGDAHADRRRPSSRPRRLLSARSGRPQESSPPEPPRWAKGQRTRRRQAGQGRRSSETAAHGLGDTAQGNVAGAVAARVVHRLETVNVDQEKRADPAVAAAKREVGIELLAKAACGS